jgi:outer membrane lipoprotein-sorting protein
MKRAFLVMLVLFSAVVLARAERNYSTVQYDLILGGPAGMGSITTKVYTKGLMSRMVTQMGPIQAITVFDGTNAYMYIPSQNTAMTIPIEQAKAKLPQIGDYDANCEKLAEEAVDGKPCTVYNCSRGGEPIKMWIDKTIDFPLKTQTAQATAYFKNIIFDQPLDDSLFSLPQGVQFQSMPQGLPGGAQQGDTTQW